MPNITKNFDKFLAKDRNEWRNWLKDNYNTSKGVWLVYYKKNSQRSSVTYEEAVEEALCFGWIDSTVNSIDEERYMQLYTPRKINSIWSKLNKERVENLIRQGLMTDAGFSKIDAAKKNGSWDLLSSIDDLIIPIDLEKAFSQNETAYKNFNEFKNPIKKAILYWVISAKRPETRKKRIEKIIATASENTNPFNL
ncbi:MAG: hypothetical protein AMQ74_01594 [Candidatus Methanofastidiosum methylothiophilum]|uniref:Bacteriocin-protection, YdeI or OmpD-Associated n=1 Tax=Candidatus Methanofastidiosum methylothiophilum TaxID=1705564 RepID=A0A150IUG6_9EURY|nr:MAG: hypothetical protein AMQ74_01594 [Candidatus Methanofastidiosum methylthiophilus]NMC77174.1 hypothetical protein [Candidatus Methanofastidiosa archaeon]